MKVYVVWGTTGEHEDTVRWNVKAFLKEASAKEFIENLETYFKNWKTWDWPTQRDFRHPLDPGLPGIWYVMEYKIDELEVE